MVSGRPGVVGYRISLLLHTEYCKNLIKSIVYTFQDRFPVCVSFIELWKDPRNNYYRTNFSFFFNSVTNPLKGQFLKTCLHGTEYHPSTWLFQLL